MTLYADFRDLTEEYVTLDFHQRRLALLASRIAPGSRVLDVGCNGGYLAGYLPGCEVHGIDPSEVAVRAAQSRLASASVGVAEALPFPDQSMDVVVMGYILERVADPALVLREAHRVARQWVVGDTPHEDGPWGKAHVSRMAPFVLRCFNREELMQVLGPAALVDVVSWGQTPAMYSFAVKHER